MGFGGKSRKATGKCPGIPHHPRARYRRNRYWSPDVWKGIVKSWRVFEEMQAATERAIEALFIDSTVMLGLDASMAPRFRHDTVNPCTAAVAIPNGDENDALVCALIAGHDDWHLDTTGARWRVDGDGVIVQPVATIESVTTEVRVERP